jgi:lipopolysaccharide/colanic/teichoic acid biosynthesis glycosyltransferase
MWPVVKRAMDILIAGAALLCLLPLLALLCIILRLTGEGEVFYRQDRVGYGGQLFGLFKFVTMMKNSPNLGTGTITIANDPRVLPLGRFLRKTKINELPQLVNVLLGHMSIVGPRPQTQECYGYFPKEGREQLFLLKPGLTGVGSVVFRDEETILSQSPKGYARCYREDIMPYKLALECWYLRNQSLWVDLKIIALTALAIMFPGNTMHERWLNGLPPRP